ncbi:hypothetical protein FHG66_02115 [Rubellimicrobium rubrum]|uniref:HTH luxR-type domain-containing protein n=1 Tax=Rubellimicrobium rubrum TaxID=2585369 RepID=A0A5C4N2A7_9RHOB|nr:LuxR C-terminal-related transcriptional regulator [Rubellimicrobium rubrum]TNC52359.1 hypothetical protein FHG66_02115 [Rubellimicrobium rubrum]
MRAYRRDLLAAVNRAAIDPDAWQGVMDSLAASLPGLKPGLVGYDAALHRNRPGVQANYDPDFVQSYAAHYGAQFQGLDAWTSLPVGYVAHSFEIIAEADLLATELYNDWLRPQGDLRHAAMTVLSRGPGQFFLFTAQLELHVAERRMAGLLQETRDLVPQMMHALDMNRMLLGLRLDAVLLRQGVEPQDAGVLLLSDEGIILHANARAEAMLAEGDLLRHDWSGRLAFVAASPTARLRAALRGQARTRDLTFQLERSQGGHEVRLARVTDETLGQLALPAFLRAWSPALLVVVRPAHRLTDEARPLMARLGLSRSEAEVTLALAKGATLAEIAEGRGVARVTVRDQIRAAMGKASVHRQVDLVRLVLELRRTDRT